VFAAFPWRKVADSWLKILVFWPMRRPVSMFFFLSRVGFSWFFYINQRITISHIMLYSRFIGHYRSIPQIKLNHLTFLTYF
jgi:hypothetical protein